MSTQPSQTKVSEKMNVHQDSGYSFRKRSKAYALISGVRYRHGWTGFDEPEYWILPQLIVEGQNALDIGSNVGMYALRISRLVGSEGRVVAVEPQPVIAKNLERTRRLLRIGNLAVLNAACGERSGETGLDVPVGDAGGLIDGEGHLVEPGSGMFQVRLITVDSIVEERRWDHLALIKIDVEGAELSVLKGAQYTIERLRPRIICELQDKWAARFGRTASDAFAFLSSRGYRGHITVEGRLAEVPGVVEEAVNYTFLP